MPVICCKGTSTGPNTKSHTHFVLNFSLSFFFANTFRHPIQQPEALWSVMKTFFTLLLCWWHVLFIIWCIWIDQLLSDWVYKFQFTLGHINVSLQNGYIQVFLFLCYSLCKVTNASGMSSLPNLAVELLKNVSCLKNVTDINATLATAAICYFSGKLLVFFYISLWRMIGQFEMHMFGKVSKIMLKCCLRGT